MTNWFAGIGQASTGLNAARYGLSVVSQNIANADTEGYTRQTAQQSALESDPTGLYTRRGVLPQLSGVTVTSTARSDDPVLDARVRDEHQRGAATDVTASTLSSIEDVVGEPSTTGLSAQLSAYWSSWGTVANDPGNSAPREVLLRNAQSAVATLNSLASSVSSVASSTSASLASDLSQANSAAQQLATLNGQIAIASATGQTANNLLDSRDQLLDTLSKLVGGVASIGANGAATVTAGGQTLVSGGTAAAMTVDSTNQVSVGGSAVTLSGGSAAARVTALVTTIPGFLTQLDGVANALAAAGNAIQAAGYDGNGNPGAAMFSGSGAAGLTVAITDPSGVAAASTSGGSLDGSNALQASQHGSAADGPDVAFATFVGALGTATSLAAQQQTTQSAVVTNVDALHASVSGVSYDDEVSSMLTYQHAFSASSRVLTTIDQMLDTLINHTGVVGRA